VLNLNTLATSTLDGSAFLTMAGRTQIENGITGDGDDTIIGNTLANKLYGMRGDDSIDAGAGDDWLDGGTGVDTLSGGTGNDTYVVDDANDQVIEGAAAGTDLVRVLATWVAPANVENILVSGDGDTGATGNSGANVMTGNSGANALNGLGGNDSLAGGGGSDTLDGGEGADTLDGGAANDSLLGGNGNDSLLGGAGNDTISGGAGKDTINGGAGKDTIVLNELPAAGQADSVVGFSAVDDTFQLLKTGMFTALATLGTLNGAAFWSGTAAHDADDRIIYNPTSGALLYDADGNGAGAAVQIATLTGLAGALTQADFVVVA
jgi:serralysin